MRRVLLGGLIGAAPGALFLLTVFILETTDVISSDASQIGFIGLPILFLGTLIGLVIGSSTNPHGAAIGVGALLGVAAGIAAGIGIGEALRAAGVSVGGLWLILGPLGMIGGGVTGAWWGEHHTGPSAGARAGTA